MIMLKMFVWVLLWTLVFGSIGWLLWSLDHGTHLKAWLLWELGAFCFVSLLNIKGLSQAFGPLHKEEE